MKTCIECLEPKPLSAFGKRAAAHDGLNPRCLPCRAAYERRNYALSPEHQRERRKAELARYQARAKTYIDAYLLRHPCVDCGEADLIVLEFDHVRGTKVNNISRLRLNGAPLAIIQTEIEKCEVRCANCHRRATHRRAQGTQPPQRPSLPALQGAGS